MTKIKVFDLFCGIGGLSLGFNSHIFEVVGAADSWVPAIDVYKKNFSHPVVNQDLSKVDQSVSLIKEFSNLDMIVGGSPCQDFSSAGLRNEDGDKAVLTLAYAQIISAIKPEWFVMENVDRFMKSKLRPVVIEVFRRAGYHTVDFILNAALCGVPQSRKRYFCIGRQDDKNISEIAGIAQNNLALKQMNVRNSLQSYLDIDYYYRHPRSYNRRAIFSVDEPSPTIRGVNRPIPKTYQFHSGDAIKSFDGVRHLTTKERSLIQTFPSGFDLDFDNQSVTNIEQAIGNAVPVNLARFVASCVSQYINPSNAN